MAKTAEQWRNRIVGEGDETPDQLLANPKNWRVHPKHQQDALQGVLEGVGWVQRVIVNQRTNFVVDGHARVALAITHNQTSVPVLYVDLDDSEEDLILATLDPISAMAASDKQKLDELLREVNSDSAAVQQMLSDLAVNNGIVPPLNEGESPGDAGAQLDRATQLRDKYNVQRGQLWTIGRHRLLCGDAYEATDIDLLLNGEKPDMLHTDPPYGINIVKPSNGSSTADSGGAKPFGATGQSNRKGESAIAERNSGKVGGGRGGLLRLHAHANVGRGNPANIVQSNLYPVIEGDDRPFDPSPFLEFAPIVILWGANYFADKLPIKAGWIVWDKREDITRNNFADCELAWTNLDSPARLFHHLWNGLHKGSQHGERRIHPTEKPVALFESIGNLLCPHGLWVDLFAGSGAQIVAAEKTGSRCYALEYEPLYVACILQRLADMGLEPRLA